MEETQGQGLKLILCEGKPLMKGPKRGWARKYEKPLKTVSMLKKRLWETEISLFSPSETLYYPPHLSQEEVRGILKRMRKKRLLWLLGFSLLLPITIPLTPIPGPNLPYYYALGRIILHFRSQRTLGKLLKSGKYLPLSHEDYRKLKDALCP